MGIYNVNLTKYLPAKILSLGWPDGIESYDLENSSLHCVDIKRHKGNEIVADINYPQEFGRYDLVLDPGTVEHCFNIGRALINAAKSVRLGGRVIHGSPVSMVNHGYYNLCPMVLRDFYETNGFEVEFVGLYDQKNNRICEDLKLFARTEVPAESVVVFIAQCNREQNTFKYPIQDLYR